MRVIKTTDVQHRRMVEDALVDNGGYCPCMLVKTDDTKCMCKDFRDKINDPYYLGPCHCGLYEKIEA